jgi:hypothetical protein
MIHQRQSTLIHVGYVKTGSTWMQSELIWNPEYGYLSAVDRAELTCAVQKQIEWEENREAYLHQVTQANILKAAERGLTPVISHECISGNPVQGGYLAPTNLRVLHNCFPDAKILICIREQKSLLKSYYHEYINIGGVTPIHRLVDPPIGEGRLPLSIESYFCYHYLVREYINTFGRENVMIEPFERFRQDAKDFAKRLAAFVGRKESLEMLKVAPERVSKPPLQIALERQYNRYFYYNRLNPGGLIRAVRFRKFLGVSSVITPNFVQNYIRGYEADFVKQWARGKFGASNRALCSLTGIDLSVFGYDCELQS